MLQTTRRGFFGLLAAAFVAKPVAECLHCQGKPAHKGYERLCTTPVYDWKEFGATVEIGRDDQFDALNEKFLRAQQQVRDRVNERLWENA